MIQNFLLRIYECAARRGVFHTRVGREIFYIAYKAYKILLEARGSSHLREFAPPGSTVIDVGANIGFFAMRFADWVGPNGLVIAIEPEAKNLDVLRQRIKRHNIEDRVHIIPAVATNLSGTARLKINPVHPGDHCISDTGIEVAAVTIDDLMNQKKIRTLSLIKIDVQGAEMRVLAGARASLAKFKPTLVIEIGDAQLRRFGSSASNLIDELIAQNYRPYLLTSSGIGQNPEDRETLLRRATQSYCDVVFRPNELC